jgi:hypothetical protein
MSSWLEAIGWINALLGTYLTWRAGRSLLRRTSRGSNRTGQIGYVRRMAWRDLRFGLLWVVIGAGWAMSWNKHWPYVWLYAAYVVALAGWETGALLRSRRRRSHRRAAAAP